MVANVRHLRISRIRKTCLRKLSVTGINVIHDKVIDRSSDHPPLRNLGREKHDISTHEIFNVVHSKRRLDSDLGTAKVRIYVQGIDKYRYPGSLPVHLLKRVLYASDCH